MADNSVVQTIKDAEIDARSLSEFISKDASFTVNRRLASTVHTLDYYIDWLNNVASNVGFVIKGSFTDGVTLSEPHDAISGSDGKLYRWGGSLPKTVPSGSTPQNTGGFATNAWVEVSDSSIRVDLASGSGANLVGVNIDGGSTYKAGTVGAMVARRRVEGDSLLSKLNSDNDSGTYYVVNTTDTPFNGVAEVNIFNTPTGAKFGTCVLQSTDGSNRRAVATMQSSKWSDFELQGESNKFPIATGGYSWWTEPQTLQVDSIVPRVFVGAVDMQGGRLVSVDSSSTVAEKANTKEAYLQPKDEYRPDEHNAPASIIVKNKLLTFYPGHNDKDYLGYRVSTDDTIDNLGAEQQIPAPKNRVSYAQVLHSKFNDTLYVVFRAGGSMGGVNAWYLAKSSDWDADVPTWDVKMLVEDSEQMYCRIGFNLEQTTMRFVVTKNARYADINGIWYGYYDLRDDTIKTSQREFVANLGESVTFDMLTKIYSVTSGRIRLYDFKSRPFDVEMLVSTHPNDNPDAGSYRFLRYRFSDWRMIADVEIVATGKSLGDNYYYGGAHFSNNLTGQEYLGSIYVARESTGTWYVEEWQTVEGRNGGAWQMTRVIDSSSTQKLWRPRVPVNTVNTTDLRGRIVLTWCKGTWAGYVLYNSKIWALRE